MKKEKVKKTKDLELEIQNSVKSLNLSPKLEEAALYTLKLPGKRLRPKFVMASGMDFGVDREITMKVACATEIMHAGSLIHDDLPPVDNDNYRRGKPSNHVIFGEDIAIMAGDLLFSIAGFLCTESKNNDVIRSFTKTLVDLVDGETRDILMSKDGSSKSKDEIMEMYRKKTGALFAFAFSFGPFMANEDPNDYIQAGYDFGISFQILDDILDVQASFEEIGKTPHKDAEENKATLVKIIGIEESKKIADTLYEEALSKLNEGFLYQEVRKVPRR
uniref:Polyprenyl synthetase family protein n=1 Tax=Mesoaciditoga lauensis TaxID=1495039 RepID=A0A7V3RFC5_9BACT